MLKYPSLEYKGEKKFKENFGRMWLSDNHKILLAKVDKKGYLLNPKNLTFIIALEELEANIDDVKIHKNVALIRDSKFNLNIFNL